GERRPEAGADEDLQHQRGQWHDGKPGSGAGRALPDGHFVVLPGAALMACRRKLVGRKRGADTRVCHLVLGLQWWSGPPACHVAIPGDILRIIGISYLKNVGTNADMAGQRPTPPLARKLSGIGM